MRDSLEDGDASGPAMEEIEVVVGNLEDADEGVVAESEKHSGDEVERCKSACATTKSSHDGLVLLGPVQCKAPSEVQSSVHDEHQEVPASWKGTVVNGS